MTTHATSHIDVVGFDHLVLRVTDVEASIGWYCDELGLDPVRVEAWRRGEVPFPSLRVSPEVIVDLVPPAPDVEPASGPARNLDHLCLVVAPCDLGAVRDSGRFRVVDGPATRFGARGDGTSLYVLDPDDNVVELRHY